MFAHLFFQVVKFKWSTNSGVFVIEVPVLFIIDVFALKMAINGWTG